MFIKSLKSFIAGLAFLMPIFAYADFGLDTSQDFFTVDTGAGLTFKVERTSTRSKTHSPGDIASLVYNGTEYLNQLRGSQVNSGFDWLYSDETSVAVSATTNGPDVVKVTVQAGDLTHYYMARRGYPHIYMATHFTREPDVHNLVRYILRLDSELVSNGPVESDLRGTDPYSPVEAGDIFGLPNGETRSKHYSNMRLKDWSYMGANDGNIGMWFVRDGHEGGSGGPFYRSLLNQATDTDQELTYIVNYGQAQTEKFRTGTLNHYTLVVTDGSAPETAVDTSWFDGMGLKGYVPPSGRGLVAGVGLSGMDNRYEYTVGFANERAQYWADASNGFYKVEGMLPGDYDLTVYKNELEVYQQQNISVEAGGKTLLNTTHITDDPEADASIWRIGQWDGSPREFLNGDKLTRMHPSDSRISTWDPENFIVGLNTSAEFPAYLWSEINNDHVVYFRLNSNELATTHTLRIGVTCATANGRPQINLNGWDSPIPSASSQPRSRSLTTGSYRCNNHTYTYNIPAHVWAQDPGQWNTLTISVRSGSGLSGYLSAGVSIDSIDLLQ